MSGGGWHLDKRVPISLILAIVVQTVAVIVFMSRVESRVTYVEARTVQLEVDMQIRRAASAQNATSIAVINQNLSEIHRTLERIEKKMDEK